MHVFPPRLLAWSLSLTLLAAAPQLRAATEYFALDPVHTRVAFQVSHAGFSNPLGTFSGTRGNLQFDETDWSSAQVDVTIPLATLDLGDQEWNGKILDATFFDAKKYPEAHFISTRVERTGEQTATIHGNLTLHGVTRPVTLAATFNALKRHPLTLRRTVGFSATATISRADFGMDSWKKLVGDEVKILIEVEARRGKTSNDTAKEPADADQE